MNNDIITEENIKKKTENLTRLIYMILFHAEANIFSFPLVNVFIKKNKKNPTNSVLSYQFPIDGNLSFCFISM